jgi:prepilin peptidase CpaA
MTTGGLFMCLPMLGLLTWAAAVDMRCRRIPNWITFSMMLAGFAQSFTWARTVGGPADSMLGFLTGFGLTFIMFGLNAMGGGDVKLLAAIGAWLGPVPTLLIFAAESIIGMLWVLAQAGWEGRLKRLLQNSTVIAMSLATAVENGGAGLDEAAETGKACSSPSRLPYAVPVLFATILIVSRL